MVLLVGTIFISAALRVTRDFAGVSRAGISDLRLYNAAVQGIEQGKAWLTRRISEDASGPRSSGPTVPILAEARENDFGATLRVEIYDANFSPWNGSFDPELPPRLPPEGYGRDESVPVVLNSDYAASGSGGFSEGAEGTEPFAAQYAYLIRSIASLPAGDPGEIRTRRAEALILWVQR
jgi:hypothetical protein